MEQTFVDVTFPVRWYNGELLPNADLRHLANLYPLLGAVAVRQVRRVHAMLVHAILACMHAMLVHAILARMHAMLVHAIRLVLPHCTASTRTSPTSTRSSALVSTITHAVLEHAPRQSVPLLGAGAVHQ
eukprot:2867042-Rhodomonas_salina.1